MYLSVQIGNDMLFSITFINKGGISLLKDEIIKLLMDFGSNLSRHEYNQYMPKLRDFLIPYILKEKGHVSNPENLFKHEFTRYDLIKSTEYYILTNDNVKSKSAIDDFLIALNRFFEEYLLEKYPNQNLLSVGRFTKLSLEVEDNLASQGNLLKEREAYPPIDENQFTYLIELLKAPSKDTLTSTQVRIITKLLLFYGFKFNRVINLSVNDFDHDKRTLNINCDRTSDGIIKLELPYSLYNDFTKQYNLRIHYNCEYNNLFITKTGAPITNAFISSFLNRARDSYFSRLKQEEVIRNPFTPTGLAKLQS